MRGPKITVKDHFLDWFFGVFYHSLYMLYLVGLTMLIVALVLMYKGFFELNLMLLVGIALIVPLPVFHIVEYFARGGRL